MDEQRRAIIERGYAIAWGGRETGGPDHRREGVIAPGVRLVPIYERETIVLSDEDIEFARSVGIELGDPLTEHVQRRLVGYHVRRDGVTLARLERKFGVAAGWTVYQDDEVVSAGHVDRIEATLSVI